MEIEMMKKRKIERGEIGWGRDFGEQVCRSDRNISE